MVCRGECSEQEKAKNCVDAQINLMIVYEINSV